MKKLLCVIGLCFAASFLFSQTVVPLQYVVYSAGDVVKNKSILLRIVLQKGSFKGEEVYIETQLVRTNAQGVATVKIGSGLVDKGSFSEELLGECCVRIEQDFDNTGTYKPAFAVSYIKGYIPEEKVERSLKYIYDSKPLIVSEEQMEDKIIYFPKDKELGSNSPVNGEWNMSFIQNAGAKEHCASNYCANYVSHDGKDTWYLPSIEELLEMCRHKEAIGNIKDDEYWSSTEDGKYAWRVNMSDCTKASFGKSNYYFIRCIRKE